MKKALTNLTKMSRPDRSRGEDPGSQAPESRGEWGSRIVVVFGMVAAILGGSLMGGAAVTVASGEPLGVVELYAALATTVVAARVVRRRGGGISLGFCAGMIGLAVVFGPMLAM